MPDLPIIVTYREKNMLRVDDSWNGDIVIEHLTLPTPESDWQFYQRLDIPKPDAIALAVAILEKADATHMLLKKHQPVSSH